MLLLPLITGLVLFFAGIVIGYLFSYQSSAVDEDLESERDQLANDLKIQQTATGELGSELQKQTAKIQLLDELCQDFKDKKKSADQQIIDLQANLTTQSKLTDEASTRLADESSRRAQLEERLHELRSTHVESLNQQKNDWRERMDKKNERIIRLENEVERLKNTGERVTEKLQQAESRVGTLESDLENQQILLQTATTNASGLEKEYISLETSLKSHSELLNEARGKAAAATSARELAEDAVKDLRQQLEYQQEKLVQLDDLKRTNSSSEKRITELQGSLETARNQLAEVSTRRDEAVAAKQSAQAVIASLKKRTENQEMAIRTLRNSSEQLTTRVQLEADSRKELDTNLNQMRRQFEMQSEAYENLERQHEELKTALTKKSNDYNELEELKAAELESIASDMSAELEQKNKEFQERIQLTITQRDQALTECNELREQLQRLQAIARHNETTIRNLRKERGAVLMRNRAVSSRADFPRLLKDEYSPSASVEYGGKTELDPVRGTIFTSPPESRDDLKRISGIAHVLEKRLNEFGIYTYKQIMEWDRRAIEEFSSLLTFKDRIERDDWKGQARTLYEQTRRRDHAA